MVYCYSVGTLQTLVSQAGVASGWTVLRDPTKASRVKRRVVLPFPPAQHQLRVIKIKNWYLWNGCAEREREKQTFSSQIFFHLFLFSKKVFFQQMPIGDQKGNFSLTFELMIIFGCTQQQKVGFLRFSFFFRRPSKCRLPVQLNGKKKEAFSCEESSSTSLHRCCPLVLCSNLDFF